MLQRNIKKNSSDSSIKTLKASIQEHKHFQVLEENDNPRFLNTTVFSLK